MPVGNVLVGDSRGHVKHDDSTLPLDIVAVSKPSKLLLTSCVPHVELYRTTVGVKNQWMYLNAKSGWKKDIYTWINTSQFLSILTNIFFFKFSSQVPFYKGCFSSAPISDKHKLWIIEVFIIRRDFQIKHTRTHLKNCYRLYHSLIQYTCLLNYYGGGKFININM